MRKREWSRFWKEVMAPSPVEEEFIRKCEAKLKARFPAGFRKTMMQANGGLVRTGFLYWFLFPFPDPSHPLPHPIIWLARPLKDILDLNQIAREFDGFPPDVVAFGLRQEHSFPDGVLCFRRNESEPQLLDPEVWLWHWFKKPFKEFRPDASLLWADNPFRKPKPARNWRLKSLKAEGNTDFDAFLKTKRKKLSGKDRMESDWLFAKAFPLVGERIEVCDCLGIPNEYTEGWALGTGTYDLLLRVMTDSNERRISRLRFVKKGRAVRLGEVIGEVSVDGGAVSVFDVDPIVGCDPEVLQELEDRIILTDLKGLLRCFTFGPTTIAMIRSGYGDGSYPVFALRDGGDLVGVEVEFVPSLGAQ